MSGLPCFELLDLEHMKYQCYAMHNTMYYIARVRVPSRFMCCVSLCPQVENDAFLAAREGDASVHARQSALQSLTVAAEKFDEIESNLKVHCSTSSCCPPLFVFKLHPFSFVVVVACGCVDVPICIP